MSVMITVLPEGIAGGHPLGQWTELARGQGAPENSLTAASGWRLIPHLRELGAVYEMDEPPPPPLLRYFPELSPSELGDLWSGEPPPGVDPERVTAFQRAEIAWAQTRQARPGTPTFKLTRNGPPWHITRQECADLVALTAARSGAESDPDPERNGWRTWQLLSPLFAAGAEGDGVLAN